MAVGRSAHGAGIFGGGCFGHGALSFLAGFRSNKCSSSYRISLSNLSIKHQNPMRSFQGSVHSSLDSAMSLTENQEKLRGMYLIYSKFKDTYRKLTATGYV